MERGCAWSDLGTFGWTERQTQDANIMIDGRFPAKPLFSRTPRLTTILFKNKTMGEFRVMDDFLFIHLIFLKEDDDSNRMVFIFPLTLSLEKQRSSR